MGCVGPSRGSAGGEGARGQWPASWRSTSAAKRKREQGRPRLGSNEALGVSAHSWGLGSLPLPAVRVFHEGGRGALPDKIWAFHSSSAVRLPTNSR